MDVIRDITLLEWIMGSLIIVPGLILIILGIKTLLKAFIRQLNSYSLKEMILLTIKFIGVWLLSLLIVYLLFALIKVAYFVIIEIEKKNYWVVLIVVTTFLSVFVYFFIEKIRKT